MGYDEGFGADFRTWLRRKQVSGVFVSGLATARLKKDVAVVATLEFRAPAFVEGVADSRRCFSPCLSSSRLVTGGKERKRVLRSGGPFR